MLSLLLTFAIYYVVLFVVCFFVVSQGQDALYDEATPGFEWKVAVGSLLLALLLTWTRSSFATMFTDEIGKTVLQAIVWFGVFVLIFRFHPWHGAGIGLATMLIVTGLASLAVESLFAPKSTQRFEAQQVAKPIRRPAYAAPQPTQAPAPAPATK